MKVAIRADASREIGSGHVMRCLVLADALAARGFRAHFICRAHPGHQEAVIVARGHSATMLPAVAGGADADGPPHARWLGADQTSDAAATRATVDGLGGADLLVVDHYALDRVFETALRSVVGRIAVIDDLADRPHDCDVLIDQTAGRQAAVYDGLVPAHARLLLGETHALVPPAFAEARRPRDGAIRRILVFLGGVDAGNASLDALVGLEAAGVGALGIAVDVLVGGLNPHREALASFAESRAWVRLLAPVPSLAPLLAGYDLAIGAGGVSAVERAAAGLPSLTLAVADNQVAAAEALAASGALIFLGRHDAATAGAVADAARLLIRTPSLVAHLAGHAGALCDGHGLSRVVACLADHDIALRRATMEDGERLWRWRNHPDTRRHAGDSAEISLERHLAWLSATFARRNRDLLIGRNAQGDVGVLRFDVDGETAVVSVYLDPARRGGGLGLPLLEAGTRWLAERRPTIRTVEARVFAANAASRRVFRAAGYIERESLFVLDMPVAMPENGVSRVQQSEPRQ